MKRQTNNVKNFILSFFDFTNIHRFVCRLVVAGNVLRAGARNPVLRLRQGYGACTLLADDDFH
jgi:hypothetical protein